MNFDGDINSLGPKVLVNPKYVENLREIINQTAVKIVVSSARKNFFGESMLGMKIQNIIYILKNN